MSPALDPVLVRHMSGTPSLANHTFSCMCLIISESCGSRVLSCNIGLSPTSVMSLSILCVQMPAWWRIWLKGLSWTREPTTTCLSMESKAAEMSMKRMAMGCPLAMVLARVALRSRVAMAVSLPGSPPNWVLRTTCMVVLVRCLATQWWNVLAMVSHSQTARCEEISCVEPLPLYMMAKTPPLHCHGSEQWSKVLAKTGTKKWAMSSANS